jgi:hypothetical protein
VLVLNSIRLISFVVGLTGDLPNIDSNPPASKPRNEFTLERTDILNLLFTVEYYFSSWQPTINHR